MSDHSPNGCNNCGYFGNDCTCTDKRPPFIHTSVSEATASKLLAIVQDIHRCNRENPTQAAINDTIDQAVDVMIDTVAADLYAEYGGEYGQDWCRDQVLNRLHETR